MEPFTIASSLATVVQLAGYGLDFALQMNKFVRQLGTVREDVEVFLCEVETLSRSITLAKNTLIDYYSSHLDPHSLRFLSIENILENLDKMSKWTRYRLKGTKDIIFGIESRLNLITLIKWNIRKDSVLEVSSKLKSIQLTMNILMNEAQLEGKTLVMDRMGYPRSPEDRAELKKLRKEIKTLKKTMAGFIEAIEKESTKPGQDMTLSERQLLSSLIKLGKNATKPLAPLRAPSPVRSTPSHRRNISETTSRSSRSGGRVSSASRDLESLRRNSLHYSSPSPTTAMSADPDDYGIKPGFRQSVVSLESVRVEPIRKVLDLRDDLPWQAIVGEINAPGPGFKTVPQRWNAKSYEGLDRNVISIVQAKHLGLPDPVLDDNNVEIMIDVGNGRPMRSLGKTTLEWRPTVRSSLLERVLTLECEVCDRYDQPERSGLWFGKPFFEASSSSRT